MSIMHTTASTSPRSPEAEVRSSVGWSGTRVAGPSQLVGANGIAFGPDGRLHIAQLYGSRIGALDIETGEVATVWPASFDGLTGPDDVAFDSRGVMYVADMSLGQVRSRTPAGVTAVVADDLPSVNGITCWRDRVFVDECRHGGRLLEVFLDGRPPKVLLEDLDTPNALQVGPDGYLYFPLVIAGEVWRIPVDGGDAERVGDGFGFPLACRFAPGSERVTIAESGTGLITELDPATGARNVVARTAPGSDNIAFSPDGRLFVSFISGSIGEIRDGEVVPVIADGCIWPLGLAATPDGVLVADLPQMWRVSDQGIVPAAGMFDEHGSSYPGFVTGVAAAPEGGVYVTTTGGELAWFSPDEHASRVVASGFDVPTGLAVAVDGSVLVAESAGGRLTRVAEDGRSVVAADGLSWPMGVATAPDGAVYVAEARTGAIRRIGTDPAVVADGFDTPHGVALRGTDLFVVDAGSGTLTRLGLSDGSREIVAEGLPVGERAGAAHPGHDFVPGVLVAFSGAAADDDGAVWVSCDRDGSIWRFRSVVG